MATYPPLINPATSPPQPAGGPGASDNYPDRQARGRFGGPAYQAAKSAIEAAIAKELLNVAERRALLAADARLATVTAGGIDETPGLGEGVMAGEAIYGVYQGVRLAQALRHLASLYEQLKALEKANVQVQSKRKKAKDCKQWGGRASS